MADRVRVTIAPGRHYTLRKHPSGLAGLPPVDIYGGDMVLVDAAEVERLYRTGTILHPATGQAAPPPRRRPPPRWCNSTSGPGRTTRRLRNRRATVADISPAPSAPMDRQLRADDAQRARLPTVTMVALVGFTIQHGDPVIPELQVINPGDEFEISEHDFRRYEGKARRKIVEE